MKATERRPIVGVGPALTRRAVLRLLAGATAAAGFPFGVARLSAGWAAAVSTSSYGFLTAAELAILDAATAHILPTDDRPGAREIGVVGLHSEPAQLPPGSRRQLRSKGRRGRRRGGLAAGGGRSGRFIRPGATSTATPSSTSKDVTAGAGRGVPRPSGVRRRAVQRAQPAAALPHRLDALRRSATARRRCGRGGGRGAATVDVFPPDAFSEFLPLTRLQVMSWKVRLLGAEAVPEVAENPLAASLPDVALRARLSRRPGATRRHRPQAHSALPFVELAADQRTQVSEQGLRTSAIW